MHFEDNKVIEKTGESCGYILSYILFTTLLFLVLSLMHKLPSSWTYMHITIITFIIAFAGNRLRKYLG